MQDDHEMLLEAHRVSVEREEWVALVEADNEALRAQVTELQYILTDRNSRITRLEATGDKVAESYLTETLITAELRKIIIAREAELKAVCDELGKMKLAYEMSEALRKKVEPDG